ncbi:CDP-glucose 4,6-dehydratase [Patescibacteria group bacterium]|nr:CDP-glucose 4,6-dehydratase [Patescibacteria group bacterium]
MSAMFDEIYKNKRVLITGHTGFKGSWLAIWLKELGADIVGYSLDPPSEPNNFEATKLREKVTHIHGDIRDLDRLLETFKKYQPEFVFHLAAQPLVRLSYDEPKMTFDTNVGGTVNVFEAVRKTPSVKVLVNITSDKCYENKEWVWGYRENDPMGGHDPYSASKGCAELVFNAYLKSFFSQKKSGDTTENSGDMTRILQNSVSCPRNSCQNSPIGAASARAGNVIGGGDWGADRLDPDCIRALNGHQPIGIRSPRAVRPWQHVLEPLGGYLQLAAALWQDPQKYSEPWNFGPDDGSHLTVAEMADRLIKYWGDGKWGTDLKSVPQGDALHEAKLLKLNCDKAHAELHWHSVLTIDECLQMTAEWYKIFYAGSSNESTYKFCTQQIAEYVESARKRGNKCKRIWLFQTRL